MNRQVLSAVLLTAGIATAIPGSITLTARAAAFQLHDAQPSLANICLVTNDVDRLAAFYRKVLKVEPERVGNDYLEFRTGSGVLAVFSAEAQEKYIPGSTKPGENHSAILEFKVTDVDAEYERLHEIVKTWVKGPTNQPWGTRSIYFRDPDGNLVNFFTFLGSV